MKKNVMMRVASVMLVLVLMSSSVISGTFAKYVTAGNAGDTARVAHWGVTVDVTGNEAFKTEYDGTASAENTDTVTVKSSTLKKLVAPGTGGTLATVDVNGSPEVDATIAFAADITISDWLIDHDKDPGTASVYYCPLVITVGSTKLVGNTYDNAEAFATAIENQINNTYSQYYNAHDDLAAVADVEISWAWNFSTNSDDVEQTDVLDTILGDKAADAGDAADSIALELTVTVTQVD